MFVSVFEIADEDMRDAVGHLTVTIKCLRAIRSMLPGLLSSSGESFYNIDEVDSAVGLDVLNQCVQGDCIGLCSGSLLADQSEHSLCASLKKIGNNTTP